MKECINFKVLWLDAWCFGKIVTCRMVLVKPLLGIVSTMTSDPTAAHKQTPYKASVSVSIGQTETYLYLGIIFLQ